MGLAKNLARFFLSLPLAVCLVCGQTAPERPRLTPKTDVAKKILLSAKAQAVHAAAYTPGYFKLKYPMGDLPKDQGVCTDVVIRALRAAGYDLQKLIYEDMKRHFSSYPRREKRPDKNIDHRRCPNQMYYLGKFAKTLTLKVDPKSLPEWQPGDIVFWKLDNGLDHTGIVSDRRNYRGEPFVIHNIWKCAEEDVLTQWKIVGHFRFPK